MRTFKVERILDLALTPRTFEAPEAGVLAATLRRAWDIIADQPPTEVVLRFDPAVARPRRARRRWHPSQEVRELPRRVARVAATVAGTIEIRLWILSWGDEVEVLEPPELRDDVARAPCASASPVRVTPRRRPGDRVRRARGVTSGGLG